jgi:hypothetical protein
MAPPRTSTVTLASLEPKPFAARIEAHLRTAWLDLSQTINDTKPTWKELRYKLPSGALPVSVRLERLCRMAQGRDRWFAPADFLEVIDRYIDADDHWDLVYEAVFARMLLRDGLTVSGPQLAALSGLTRQQIAHIARRPEYGLTRNQAGRYDCRVARNWLLTRGVETKGPTT